MSKRLSLKHKNLINRNRYIIKKLASVSNAERKRILNNAPSDLYKTISLIFKILKLRDPIVIFEQFKISDRKPDLIISDFPAEHFISKSTKLWNTITPNPPPPLAPSHPSPPGAVNVHALFDHPPLPYQLSATPAFAATSQ